MLCSELQFNEALSSGEPKPIISNDARRPEGNIGNYWLRVTTWYIHCKIANFGARQATLSDIACQATLAFVTETKLLVYNVHCMAFALYSRSTLNGVLASSPYPKNSASVCKQACAAPNCIFIALYLHCIAFAQLWGDLQGKKLTEASLSTPFRTAYYCLLEKTRARQYIFHGYPSEAMTKHVIDPLW